MRYSTIVFGWAALLAALCRPAGRVAAQALSFDRAAACVSGSGNAPAYWGPDRQVMDAQGNTYVVGRFNGTITLGSTTLSATQTPPNRTGPSDSFVAKLDATGAYQWAVQLGDGQTAYIAGLAVDAAGDVYVTGSFDSYTLRLGTGGALLFNSSASGEAFVAKLSGTTRQWLWARRAGGTELDSFSNIVLGTAGDLYIIGGSASQVADYGPFTLTATATGPYVGVVLARLSRAGTWLSVRVLTDAAVGISSILVGPQRELYLAGSFQSPSVRLGGTTLSTQVVPGTPGGDAYDLFVAKMDSAGALQWAVQGDAVTHQNMARLSQMVSDGAGHLYVTGSYTNRSARIGGTVLPNLSTMRPQPNPLPPVPYTNWYYADAFVARLDAGTGAWDWAVRRGGAYEEVAANVAADAQGRVYVVGRFNGLAQGEGETGLAQLDGATGAWRSTQPLAPSTLPFAVHELTLDGQGRLCMTGGFYGASASFGALSVTGAGAGLSTGFLARLGAGPLATHAGGRGVPGLEVWPNPSGGGVVSVRGVPGQPVQLLDVLGRALASGRLSGGGVLALPLPAGLPAGVYLVRSAGQVRRLVVE